VDNGFVVDGRVTSEGLIGAMMSSVQMHVDTLRTYYLSRSLNINHQIFA
jgi:hypothetical protein